MKQGKIFHSVMAGHSRSKNGVASLAYVPTIHVLLSNWHSNTDVDARPKAGHNDFVIAGLDPAIPTMNARRRNVTEMPGIKPGMTTEISRGACARAILQRSAA